MARLQHEVRDVIHGFVIFDNLEKRLIDSAPFQRLKCIHQLATSYQVYPGAVHTRFEHSLGVMAVADRIFQTVFSADMRDKVHDRIADELNEDHKPYWRRVVRIAALLHDIGHLPFSHAAEEELLPEGWNHERLTTEMIRHSQIAAILQGNKPPIDVEDVVDLAWDVKKRMTVDPTLTLSPWKTLLNEIITGNTFGADRIDYLLRDSWHAGVAYGRFDPVRLIDGLRIVIDPSNDEIALGLDYGGIHSGRGSGLGPLSQENNWCQFCFQRKTELTPIIRDTNYPQLPWNAPRAISGPIERHALILRSDRSWRRIAKGGGSGALGRACTVFTLSLVQRHTARPAFLCRDVPGCFDDRHCRHGLPDILGPRALRRISSPMKHSLHS